MSMWQWEKVQKVLWSVNYQKDLYSAKNTSPFVVFMHPSMSGDVESFQYSREDIEKLIDFFNRIVMHETDSEGIATEGLC